MEDWDTGSLDFIDREAVGEDQGEVVGLGSGSWRTDIRAVGVEEGTGTRRIHVEKAEEGKWSSGDNALAQWTLKATQV